MLITGHKELLALERALSLQAYRDRQRSKYHGRIEREEESADLLEAMLLRMYEEHFPVAAQHMRERLGR